MANAKLLELVRQGRGAFGKWRRKHPKVILDLMDADLAEIDLRGANLSGANLKGADLGGANLFKAVIDGADLGEADLGGVQFLQCPQLQSALNRQSATRDEDLACGAAIPSR